MFPSGIEQFLLGQAQVREILPHAESSSPLTCLGGPEAQRGPVLMHPLCGGLGLALPIGVAGSASGRALAGHDASEPLAHM